MSGYPHILFRNSAKSQQCISSCFLQFVHWRLLTRVTCHCRSVFEQMVHYGSAAVKSWRSLSPSNLFSSQRKHLVFFISSGIQVSLILTDVRYANQVADLTVSVLVKLCQGSLRSEDRNLIFYSILCHSHASVF